VPETIPVTVTILDKEYRVSCQENEKSELIASAQYLDEKMKSLRDSAGVVGADRLAVITALNIAHEMLQAKQANEHLSKSLKNRLQALGTRIESTLSKGDELDL
jgi:cell division protein ZapA